MLPLFLFMKPTALPGIILMAWMRSCALLLLIGCTNPAGAQISNEHPSLKNEDMISMSGSAEDRTLARKLFEDAPFNRWEKQGPTREIPWKISTITSKLGFQQRLISRISIEVPGSELIKRREDGFLVLLIEVKDASGRAYRNFGILDLNTIKHEHRKSDIEFTWGAYALPGDYKVSIAAYDRKSGEHDFTETSLRMDGPKNDPLSEAWKEEPAWEFWDPSEDSIDAMFRPEMEGRLHLPVGSAKPMHVEVLADFTPSDYFHGSYDFFSLYLHGALPLFKAFTQLSVANGSLQAATLDLVHRRVMFDQDELNDKAGLDWKKLKSTLGSAHGPGVVDVRSVHHGGQNPVFLRDEIVRRMGKASENPGPEVFIIIGSPTDSYSFQDLPPLYMAEGRDVRVFYIQYVPPSFQTIDLSPPSGVPSIPQRHTGQKAIARRPAYASSPANVQRMLKPLKVMAFQVSSPEEERKALARVLEELRRP
jgi:hypothetical protein